MPAVLKNTYCDPVNLKANKIHILEVGEQAESLWPLSHPGLPQKEALRWVTPMLVPTDIKVEPSSLASEGDTDTLTEMGKRETEDSQTAHRANAEPKILQ